MYFSEVTEISQLKGQYRRLAARFHPDRGGCSDLMSQINLQYEELLASLKAGTPLQEPVPDYTKREFTQQDCDQQERRRRFFHDIRVGETVFVNGTECEVQEVRNGAFRAIAKGRTRQTWFNKKDGYCSFNRRFRAAWVKNNRRSR